MTKKHDNYKKKKEVNKQLLLNFRFFSHIVRCFYSLAHVRS